jgi:hypothetical protein
MNLVKQLPIGLSLACVMFMSSCSKEDAPTPGSVVTNESSNLREIGPVLIQAQLPPTAGPTCVGCAANDWYFVLPARAATSSLTAYAGNSSKQWVQALPAPSIGVGSFVTVVNDAEYVGNAFHVINNLIKGQKYRVTFSVSTSSLNDANGESPYASKAKVIISLGGDDIVKKTIDFTGKHNQWITETLEFVATHYAYSFDIQGFSPNGETKATYTNLHVGKDAVQKIN